ncbi:MAG: glycosyltransferase [Tepidisphaeraceae bacterium]|jgi:glycosyltransferase involved in cell wall biosynthesis/SAM-dependent methyltransferase
MSSVTVIIPAYRAAETIGLAVRSVLAQTFPPDEILVIDDGSPDDLASALAEFGSSVTLIRQPNGGVASARNRGIAAARGDFLAFLDADDYWEPKKLQRQIEIFQSHPEVGLVASRFFTQYPHGVPIPAETPQHWLDHVIRPVGNRVVEMAWHVWTGTVVVRRHSLGDARFLTELEPAEDRDLWISVLRPAAGYILSEPLATAVLIPDSLSRGDPNRAYEPMIRVLERHRDLLTSSRRRRLEAQVYRGWAAAHLARGRARQAMGPAAQRLARQPFSPEAWWVCFKSGWVLANAPQSPLSDPRNLETLRRHFEIERELADRLRTAQPVRRRALYREVYNELFARVQDHPQNQRKADPQRQIAATKWQWQLLSHFIGPKSAYLEIGAGDGHLAISVARRARRAYAVDVSEIITSDSTPPKNFSWVVTDGVSIPVPSQSVTVAYSNQLMEHLHPDDALAQLAEIRRALAPGGVYVCITPHRFSGPHDISKFFSDEARGFHLKEYTYRELDHLFRQAGFAFTRVWTGVKGRFLRLPQPLVFGLETLIARLPRRWQKKLTQSAILRPIFTNVILVACKARLPAQASPLTDTPKVRQTVAS